MTHHNTVMEQDLEAVKIGACPDPVIKINTSDDKKSLAKNLKDKILERFEVVLIGISMEIWINFFHTWGCNINFEE